MYYSPLTAAILGGFGMSCLLLVWSLPADFAAYLIIHVIARISAGL